LRAQFEQMSVRFLHQMESGDRPALLACYIFAPQCGSTLAVNRRETGSWNWMAVTFGYMLALAYAASLATYNIAVALRAG
jgi:ferrous iron transport protein B